MARPRSIARAASVALLFWMAALSGGCDSGSSGPAEGSFESDYPTAAAGLSAGGKGEQDSAAQPNSGNPASQVGDGAGRAISEADVVQLDGDRLYALSRIAGLAVIDASDPTALKLLGRYRELSGTPFEMYLRGDVAILMFSGWTQYTKDDAGNYSYSTMSKVVALDVADPAAIAQLGTFDVPGTISDSRIVGDVLYVVGYEDGYCWSCEQNKPTTTVSSLNLANPRQMREVDQLRYAEASDQWSWRRSITVTNQRLYVAGPEYGNEGPIGSTIQVIDISDATGDLAPGATLEARGQISSRWQMDEYDGVLRVVSQSPAWRTTDPPQLQTFKVVSSKEFQPLAKLDIVIPAGESLQSARFDGARGYLITAQRKDPLFTLDLSDPAKPRQVGELEMPGLVYHMEPRGDRVLGLGFDQGNPEGSITVSLFDVSNFASPKLLSRVNFGGDWGSLPEDQDRIQKVFRVLPDDGLILVPFMGYVRSATTPYCGGTNVGGVQVIEYANDGLRLRGAASSDFEVRRALLHREHLLAVSDQRVESFDATERDSLALASSSTLSSTAQYAAQLDGDVVVRLVSPDWGGKWIVETTKKSAATDVDQHLAQLDLGSVFATDGDDCNRWWSIESFRAEGSVLYLLYGGYRASASKTDAESETGVVAIDASDPTKPRIVGQVSWVEPQQDGGWNAYWGDGYAGVGQATPYVWHNHRLAFFEQRSRYDAATQQTNNGLRLRVVDLRDPQKLATSTLALEDNSRYSGLIADGDQLLSTRANFSTNQEPPARVKFYAERFDIATPAAPKRLGSVNVPGVVAYYDHASGRAVTVQLHRVVVRGSTYDACYSRFNQADFQWDDPNNLVVTDSSRGTCTGLTQSFELIALGEQSAVLEDSFALKETEQMAWSAAGDGRLYVTLGWPWSRYTIVDCFGPCGPGPEQGPVPLLVFSGFGSGKLEVGRVAYAAEDTASWQSFWGSAGVFAAGDKALLFGNGGAAVIDASDAKAPEIVRSIPVPAYPQSVDIRDDAALVALGEQGLQWIEL